MKVSGENTVFVFYYEIYGKHRREIEADSFRTARNVFFKLQPQARLEMVIDKYTGERYY